MTSKKEEKRIRTRFAPSPTGPMHIGGVRTALFNYLFSKKNNGDFILRIEDTDKERSKKEWEHQLLKALDWFNLKWDEGPVLSDQQEIDFGNYAIQYIGNDAPYRQSEREEIYKKYLQKLIDEGNAYYCFCSKEEVEAQKQYLMSIGEPPIYLGKCRSLSKEQVEEDLKQNKECVIRFRTPENIKISFNDIIRGKVEFDSGIMGDFVIAKNLNNPLYNFTCVIDDALMEISHVIRGEEHLSNTPKQILLIKAFGFEEPNYAHLPLILNEERKKLSKRDGKTSVNEYIEEGYLPDALINFIALLGWNPGGDREIFSIEELTRDFSLEKIQKAGAVFNVEKLDWLNGLYLRKKTIKELTLLCIPFLSEFVEKVSLDSFRIKETREEVSFSWLEKVVSLYQERLKKLVEIKELVDLFFKKELQYNKELLKWKEMNDDEIVDSLNISLEILSNIDEKDFTAPYIQELLFKEAEKMPNKGNLLWPLRACLTGKKNSAPPMEIAEVLGKEKTLQRIKKAIKMFENE
jgi:nondiscriminating glutamyl-tRNA synthetase